MTNRIELNRDRLLSATRIKTTRKLCRYRNAV